MKPIAIIPARGGSTRIPNKNRRLFHGRPIIEYSIKAAQRSGLFSRIIVSTDELQIGAIARAAGADEIFARDVDDGSRGTQAVTAEVLYHHAGNANIACCIYATAPLMSVEDLTRGHDLLDSSGRNYAMSVGTNPLCDAAQFYWGHISAFVHNWPLIDALTFMVPIAPERVCDINVEDDFIRAEKMYAALRGDGNG